MLNGHSKKITESPAPSQLSAASTPVRNGTSSSGITISGKRIEVDGLMSEFQKLLGDNWDKYRDAVTLFLNGRLTRVELQEELDPILDSTTVRMHNQFLLAIYANALRDAPQGESAMFIGWSKKSGGEEGSSAMARGDSQLAKLKENVMELSIRERKRIKAIAKEAPKRVPMPSTVTATRQAMLPRIPLQNDATNNNNIAARQGSPGLQAQKAGEKEATPTAPSSAAAALGNPVMWAQDIIHSYEAPLATEVYELPDNDSLNTRILGICLEHGLLNGLDSQVPEVMAIGLEHYLRDLVQNALDQTRRRKKPGKEDVLSAVDMSQVLETSASCFVELGGPTYRLQNSMLVDEESVPGEETEGVKYDKATSPELQALLNELIGTN
ncbi:hypothetical protein TRVA0_051S00254 [Trichomonascus vanleenenianus]|uniref:Hfi1p n=1 Tax=Trichomonascus vanleenenianus TaxID=2268995 RepID=UPI003ECB8729